MVMPEGMQMGTLASVLTNPFQVVSQSEFSAPSKFPSNPKPFSYFRLADPTILINLISPNLAIIAFVDFWVILVDATALTSSFHRQGARMY